jgi:hypothetical protein
MTKKVRGDGKGREGWLSWELMLLKVTVLHLAAGDDKGLGSYKEDGYYPPDLFLSCVLSTCDLHNTLDIFGIILSELARYHPVQVNKV